MGNLRLLIVDDHPNVRTFLAARLGREPGFEVVGQAESSDQAVTYALENKPHVVVIDPILQDGMGIDAVKRIKLGLPDSEVVILTAFVDTSLQMELRKIGVFRILLKDLMSQNLIDILHEVARQTSNHQV